ncbi:MAG: MFS transporter [Bacteroidota bacterium]
MNPWRGLRDIPHSVWLLAFATLINRSGTMVLPFLALYMIKGMGVTVSEAGLVLTFYGAGALVTAPFVGKLSDKLGALRVMKLSLILTGIMLFVFPHIKNYQFILVYTLIWSIIGEAFRPANLSLISNETEPEQRKTAFALNRLAINLGMSIGPVVGGFLSQINFHLLFYIDGLTSVLAGIFLVFSNFEVKRTAYLNIDNGAAKEELKPAKNTGLLKDHRFLLFMITLIPVNMVFFQHIGPMPIFLVDDLGFQQSTFGVLMAVNTILIIFIEVPLNNIMAHWDDRTASAIGALLCGIGFGAMAFADSFFAIVLTIVIWTFGEMIFFPATTSYTSTVSPADRRGEYMGYFQMTFSLALMVGPWLGTVVLDYTGSVVLWIGTFVFSLFSAISFLVMKKGESKQITS